MTRRPYALSPSSVSLFARCPVQWHRRYVEKLATPTTPPMSFGKAFHAALEAEHKGENSERALVSAWNIADADLAAAGLAMHPGKAHALALLDEYKRLGLGGKMGQPEQKFTLRLLDKSLPLVTGYIDLPIPERRRFREFKTTSSKTLWTYEKIMLEHQLHVYGRAYQATYAHRPDCAEYVIFGTDSVRVEVIEAVPSPDGFRLFERVAAMLMDAVKTNTYPPCGECEICAPPSAKPANGPSFTWEEATA